MKKIDLEPPGAQPRILPFSQVLYKTGIPLPYFIPQNKKNHFFYENELSSLIPRLKVKVHSDLEQCYNLWNHFSTNESLYDLWDFRYAWYQVYEYKPFFYTIYEGKNPLASLPLWFNHDAGRYEFFGGWWSEDNTFFAKDERFIDFLFEIVPTPVSLEGIKLTFNREGKKINSFLVEDDKKSIINTRTYKSIEDYMGELKKKYRYNLKADHKRIQEQKPQIKEFEMCGFDKFHNIIDLNKKRFNGHSYFNNIDSMKGYEFVFKNAKSYTYKTIEVDIDGVKAAADLIIQYNKQYYTPIGANNVDEFSGIGYFMHYYELEDAIKNQAEIVDCSQIDYGWKHRYFDQMSMYKIEK